MSRLGHWLLPVVFVISLSAGAVTARGDLSATVLGVAEAISVTDAAAFLRGATLNTLEHVGVSDGVGLVGAALLGVAEHVGVTDSVRFLRGAVLNVAEHVGVADSLGFVRAAILNVAEHIGVSDHPGLLPAALLGVHEQIRVADLLPDRTGPSVSFGTFPKDPTNSTQATFTFTVSDPDDQGGFFVSCSLDLGAFSRCSSPVVYTGLGDGRHGFSVHASDAAGNRSQDLTYSWRVDTDAPIATLTKTPASPSSSNSGAIEFTLTDPDGDDPAGLMAACRLDGASFASCVSPYRFNSLADGAHSFIVHATDPSGNQGSDVLFQWRIDTDPPKAQITSKPADPSNAMSGSIGFALSDADGDDTVTTLAASCQLDLGVFAACTSPFPYSGLIDGLHTFRVHATDPAGNPGPDAVYSWRVDTDAPQVVITGHPANPSYVSTATFTFIGSDPDGDDAPSSLLFTCSLDGNAAPCTSPATYQKLLPGVHTFTVAVADPAGNRSSVSFTWTLIAKLVYSTTLSGNLEIYSINPDGTNSTRLTNNGAVDTSPSWSPDFSKIVFSSSRGGQLQLFVMNADGSSLVQLTNSTAADLTPSWSPDGSYIAFSRVTLGASAIWVVKLDGTGLARVTSGPNFDSTPSWSPDGKRIVFSRTSGAGTQLWLVNPDGSGLAQLTTGSGLNTSPAWSPDGGWIAYASTGAGSSQIYKIHPDGSGLIRITQSSAWDLSPAWSPDSSRIVFSRALPLPQLYTMNADGTGVTRITNDLAADITPDW